MGWGGGWFKQRIVGIGRGARRSSKGGEIKNGFALSAHEGKGVECESEGEPARAQVMLR